jgi:hypothetical protein
MPLAVMTPGRNDPCPCGSGRKYKHCCLRSAEVVDLLAVRLRSDEGRVMPALLEFTASFYGPSLLEEARDRFFDSPDYDPEADLTDALFSQLFIPGSCLISLPIRTADGSGRFASHPPL